MLWIRVASALEGLKSYHVSYINPCDAASTFESKAQFNKLLDPFHVGFHWKALVESYQMSTIMPGFQLFFNFFNPYPANHNNCRGVQQNS